ncbi:MAG: nucleotide exchange factor GrpE [Pontiellaceae bacterium]
MDKKKKSKSIKKEAEESLPDTEIIDDVEKEAEESLPDTEIIDDVEKEAEESLQDQLIRLQADFTNFRNRTQRERISLYQRANEDLLLEILPVLDYFEIGLQTAEKHNSDKAVIDGFRMILDQFNKVLDQFKLKSIQTVGEKFDPHIHEALTYINSDKFDEGVCVEQVRKGYMLGEKLLRAAQVVVSSGKKLKEEK